MRAAAGNAHNGNGSQLALHHPLEIAVQEAIDKEYVERSLVVGHKDIALLGVEIFPALDLYRQKQQAHHKPRPPLAGVIAPKMAVADNTAQRTESTGKNGTDQEDGKSDKQLIKAIEVFHCSMGSWDGCMT